MLHSLSMEINIGKWLIIIGLAIFICGLLFWFTQKAGFGNFGNLPGDINLKKENLSFHFPIVTSIIISIIVTILLNLFLWFFRK